MSGVFYFDDIESFNSHAGDQIIAILTKALQHKNRASLVLAGGSSPKGVYEYLSENTPPSFWERVDLFMGDERFLANSDENSNYKMLADSFLSKINFNEEQFFYPEKGGVIELSAVNYHHRIKEYLDNHGQFDLVLLGMGGDGHTASLFPRYDALYEQVEFAKATKEVSPLKPYVKRITMTYPALNRSHNTMFLIRGESKKEIMEKIITEKRERKESYLYPAQKISPRKGNLDWYYTN